MLVLEALRERGRMKANLPHLAEGPGVLFRTTATGTISLYFCGLTFYDLLSFGFTATDVPKHISAG